MDGFVREYSRTAVCCEEKKTYRKVLSTDPNTSNSLASLSYAYGMGSVRAFHTSLTPIPFYANNDIIAIILFRIGFYSSPVNIKNVTVFFSHTEFTNFNAKVLLFHENYYLRLKRRHTINM